MADGAGPGRITTSGVALAALLLVELTAFYSASIAVGCCLYPLVAYVYFLLEFLFIDVLKAILEIPRKVDRVEQAIRHEDQIQST